MSALSPARKLAYRAILYVEKHNSFAHETLARELEQSRLDERDRALATRLAYGVISYKGTLEELIKRLSTKKQLPAVEVSCALQIALYELFVENQKDFVAVNQGVELVKEVAPYARGFANALLRSATRLRPEFPFGDPHTSSQALAYSAGLPQWLLDQLIAEYGYQTTFDMARAFNEPPTLFAAVPTWSGTPEEMVARLAEKGVSAERVDEALPFALVFSDPAQAVQTAEVKHRQVLLMDAAAQLAVKLADVRPSQRVLEIGAGRGNKSLLLASSARGAGGPLARHVSVDLHAFKSDLLLKEARRHGVREIEAKTFDGTDSVAARAALGDERFDVAFIDAPCSGVGTLRRHVDKRWTLSPKDSSELAAINERLLLTTAGFVKPGGKIIYATCTMFNKENFEVVSKFLETEEGAQFELEPISVAMLPASWERFVRPNGTFQSIPEIGGPDGHFIAVLRRR